MWSCSLARPVVISWQRPISIFSTNPSLQKAITPGTPCPLPTQVAWSGARGHHHLVPQPMAPGTGQPWSQGHLHQEPGWDQCTLKWRFLTASGAGRGSGCPCLTGTQRSLPPVTSKARLSFPENPLVHRGCLGGQTMGLGHCKATAAATKVTKTSSRGAERLWPPHRGPRLLLPHRAYLHPRSPSLELNHFW